MEQRLIDAKALHELICDKYSQPKWGHEFAEAGFMIATEIEQAPTIDAVPVVRCRECKHRRKLHGGSGRAIYTCWLTWGISGLTGDDTFCSYGERKAQRDDDGIYVITGSCGSVVCESMTEHPTIDETVIMHGEWKYLHKQNRAVCTNCSFERDLDLNFGRAVSCPNCGANMDLE